MFIYTLSLTSVVGGVGDQRHASAILAPENIIRKAGWAPGPVWTGVENLAFSKIPSQDRPARSESLYWRSNTESDNEKVE